MRRLFATIESTRLAWSAGDQLSPTRFTQIKTADLLELRFAAIHPLTLCESATRCGLPQEKG
jgi:hypothetical protein